MKHRSILTILGFAAALTASVAAAQQPTIARLSAATGGVMVSQGDAMVAAAPGLRIGPGQRVLTTAGASATITYDNGCVIPLKENQRFTVSGGECTALLASVATIGPIAAATAGGVVGSGLIPLASIGVLLGYGVYETFTKDPSGSVTPN